MTTGYKPVTEFFKKTKNICGFTIKYTVTTSATSVRSLMPTERYANTPTIMLSAHLSACREHTWEQAYSRTNTTVRNLTSCTD